MDQRHWVLGVQVAGVRTAVSLDDGAGHCMKPAMFEPKSLPVSSACWTGRAVGVVKLRARAAAAWSMTLLGSMMSSPIAGVAIAGSGFVVATSLRALLHNTLPYG